MFNLHLNIIHKNMALYELPEDADTKSGEKDTVKESKSDIANKIYDEFSILYAESSIRLQASFQILRNMLSATPYYKEQEVNDLEEQIKMAIKEMVILDVQRRVLEDSLAQFGNNGNVGKIIQTSSSSLLAVGEIMGRNFTKYYEEGRKRFKNLDRLIIDITNKILMDLSPEWTKLKEGGLN